MKIIRIFLTENSFCNAFRLNIFNRKINEETNKKRRNAKQIKEEREKIKKEKKFF